MFSSTELMHTCSDYSLSIKYEHNMECGQVESNNCKLSSSHSLKNVFIQFEPIRLGMVMNMFDYTSTDAISINVETEFTPLTFGIILSGSFEMQYRKYKGKNATYNSIPQELLGRHNHFSGTMHLPAHERFQSIGVSISDALIEGMLYGHEEYENLQKQLNKRQEHLQMLGRWKTCPDMYGIVHQIRTCPLQGKIRTLYLEGKALEIIALQLDRLQGHSRSIIDIKRSDIEKLHEARHLLFESIEEPLSLNELAVKVGMNEFRLKQGFKKLFNNTIYGSLHKHRMEMAKICLLEGEATVTEVASSVGYTNISHFIAAFRKQYTINPGELLKNNKK